MAKTKIILHLKNCLFTLLLIFSIFASSQVSDFHNINFQKADSIADFYHGESLTNLPLLSFKLTNDLTTPVEKFRSLHTWVCKNIENDYGFYLENKRHREFFQKDSIKLNDWNKSFQKRVFTKLLEDRQTICTGYAYLVMELANQAGIKCKIIDGYARTPSSNVKTLGIPNHSWNAVQLNEKWYLCDPTWSSGNIYPFGEVSKFVHQYNDGYFLCDPSFFIKNHFPLDTAWTLTGQFSVADFLNGPIVYNSAFRYGLYPTSPKSMQLKLTKNDSITFSFHTDEQIDANKIYFGLISGSHKITADPEIITQDNGILILQHSFNKSGYSDLHIMIEDQVLITYTASVNRK
ncbi:transglutaminase domain-containing protein [Owenweeksia hongkongensis]|uniref:transglutaminase domain-containing protein n=1 Tax=Owenweeksia hongkongensis TaxID=253245 RepID=UPI003A8EDDC4